VLLFGLFIDMGMGLDWPTTTVQRSSTRASSYVIFQLSFCWKEFYKQTVTRKKAVADGKHLVQYESHMYIYQSNPTKTKLLR